MALSVTEVELLHTYLNGIMDRANHHAGNVEQIALALAGAIVWKKDDSTKIEVFERNGETKNVLWVSLSGRQYAFSYNHEIEKIEMRLGTTQGKTLYKFDNATTLNDLVTVFKGL